MAADEILRLVGKAALKNVQGDKLTLATAPKPYSGFETYQLTVSGEQGLLRIDARGNHLDATVASSSGRNDAFSGIREAVSRTYGAPMTAMPGVRTAVWDLKSTHPNDIYFILLDDRDSLFLSYACDGFEDYRAPAEAKKPLKTFVPPPSYRPATQPVTEWTLVKFWSGNGTKETELFSVGAGEWRIAWESRDEAFAGTGILQIFVKNAAGRLVSVAANKRGVGADVSYVHSPAGQYYVTVNSANVDWKVRVEVRP
jgi:hypothetical protein